jgi:uncharacterized protein (TIGR03663 family)
MSVFSFILFGASDWGARLLPAMVGTLLVLLPYGLRDGLGRTGAVVASFLLALSPTMVYFSRTMDGSIIVAAGALVLVMAARRLAQTGEARILLVVMGTMAVMLAADTSAIPVLLIFGLFALALTLRRRVEAWPEIGSPELGQGALVFLGTLALLSTGLLTNMSGFQSALVGNMERWLGNFPPHPGLTRGPSILDLLILYEPLVLVLGGLMILRGLAGEILPVLRLRLRRAEAATADNGEETSPTPLPSLTGFLVYWGLLSLLLSLVTGNRQAAILVQVVTPWALLGGIAVGQAIESDTWLDGLREGDWGLALLLIGMLFMAIAWARTPTPPGMGFLAALEKRLRALEGNVFLPIITTIGLVILATAAYLRGPTGTARSAAMALVAILTAFTVHSTVQLNLSSRPTVVEPMRPQTTAGDVRLLMQDLKSVTRRLADVQTAITVDDRLAIPFRWYLRDYGQVTYGRVGSQTKTPIIIATGDVRELQRTFGREYNMVRYRIRATWMDSPTTLPHWIRWAILREPPHPVAGEEIYVFFRPIQ